MENIDFFNAARRQADLRRDNTGGGNDAVEPAQPAVPRNDAPAIPGLADGLGNVVERVERAGGRRCHGPGYGY